MEGVRRLERNAALRVLIVEDESLIAMDHEQAVTDAGYTVLGLAWDTASALDAARAAKPDVVLMDMDLKDGPTGNTIAPVLHRDYGVKPIFITGNLDMVTPEARALSLALLPKPVSLYSLKIVLDAAARVIVEIHLA